MKSLLKYTTVVLLTIGFYSIVIFYIIPFFNGNYDERCCAIISAKYRAANTHYDSFSVEKVQYNYKEKAYQIYLHAQTSDQYITYEVTVENIKNTMMGIAGASEIECSAHDD